MNYTILIVDDDMAINDMLVKYLLLIQEQKPFFFLKSKKLI